MTTPAIDIEIFRPGTFRPEAGGAVSFSENDLNATADAYDAAVFAAPLVVGHPKTNDPAYGWVAGLSFAEGRLRARPERVAPEFADAVNAGHWPKVSASFYPPNHPDHPLAGRNGAGCYYLRHVGFLGAAAPAVKGLQPVQFAGSDAGTVSVTIDFAQATDSASLGERLLHGLRDLLATITPGGPPPTFSEQKPEETMPKDKDDDLTAREAALTAREADLKQREAGVKARDLAFAEQAAAAQAATNEAFFSDLVKAGKASPQEKDTVLGLMATLATGKALEFAEGGKTVSQSPLDAYKAQLEARKPLVEFKEQSGGDVVLRGDQVDAEDLARRITAFCETEAKAGRTVSVAAAAGILTREAKS